MRTLLITASALALAACGSEGDGNVVTAPAGSVENVAAPAGQNWTEVIERTPEGGFRMGNPDAKVKLVEYASFTCSHCRDFHKDAQANLKPAYVKTGQVSYEYRPFLLNIYDFAAVKLATCQGPDKFFTWANELYTNHQTWTEPFTKLTEADITPLRSLPPEQQIKGLALAGKLDAFAAPRGLPRARFEACLTDKAGFDALSKRQEAAIANYQIAGTPTFLINGKKVDQVTTWAQLQPKIQEAL